MSEGKSTNLLKAAKELNIGLNTAVEFLGKKGHKVEARPNTKLTDEMYDVLLKEFQGDKIVKEEAKQIVIGKIRRDDIPVSNERTEPQHSKEFEGVCNHLLPQIVTSLLIISNPQLIPQFYFSILH